MSKKINAKTVVEGEASESESDEDVESSTNTTDKKDDDDTVVPGEGQESDEDEDDSGDKDDTGRPPAIGDDQIPPLKLDIGRGEAGNVLQPQPTNTTPEVSPVRRRLKPKYDSLLHAKLKEKNANLTTHLHEFITSAYIARAKDVKAMSNHLAKSVTAIQDVSHTMRLLTNDLFHLEDKIEIVTSCCILPDINIDIPQPTGACAT